MFSPHDRRAFLKRASTLSLLAFAGGGVTAPRVLAALEPVPRTGGSRLKVALNAYSFSKLLNDHNKGRGDGISLFDLVEFCAKHNVDGLDATGYFFPGYPKVPDDKFVYELKRRAFNEGVGISGTGVRNNFTVDDKKSRAADVQHIKEWVEVASRLGAPVLRVFADTQMKGQSWRTVAPGRSRDDVEKWIADDLRECAEHGQKHGVIIGVQNHGDFLQTGDNHLSLMRRVDSEWCGPIVDTGYYKANDPYAEMAKVAPYAVNWQVKQSPAGAGSDVRIDLPRLIGIVRQAGYRGYLPIETLSARGTPYDPFKVVPPFIEEVRRAIGETV